MQRNEVVIGGQLLKRSAVRYTPAGVPVIDLLLGHRSIQFEADSQRKTRCEIEATAIGKLALSLCAAKLNQPLQLSGFLAQRSVSDRKLIVHVNKAEPLGGDKE